MYLSKEMILSINHLSNIMPRKIYKRKMRNMKNKRRYKRRSKLNTKLTLANRGIAPIADRYITRLKYVEQVLISNTANIFTDYQFRLNSLFDPNSTGTGHQPYGFDQLAQLYNRYRVYKVNYTITVEPNNTNTGLVAVVCNNSTNSLSGADPGYVMEMPRSRYASIKIDSPTVIRGSVYLPKLNGDPTIRYKSDDRFQAAVNANPAEVMILHMALCPTITTQTRVTFQLTYHAEFFDSNLLAQS